MIALARSTYDDLREGANLPVSSLTVAMSFSLANQLTAPLLHQIGDRAVRWNIRSGISREHQGEFMGRDIDMLVTGSFNLEHRDAVELHPVLEESFICVFPADYQESVDLTDRLPTLPFIRFSPLTGMGQQIERQIVRMKLKLPNLIEVESAQQQLALVSAGFGWTITTPVCLASVPELLTKLRPEPMQRGRFARQVQVVARAGELGDLPPKVATLATHILQQQTFPSLVTAYPWIKDQLVWPVQANPEG